VRRGIMQQLLTASQFMKAAVLIKASLGGEVPRAHHRKNKKLDQKTLVEFMSDQLRFRMIVSTA